MSIVLGQLGDLLGSPQKDSPAVVKAWYVISHPGDMSLTAAAAGVPRLRGRTTLGATAFIVLANYAERLRSAGGHLFLSGVEPDLLDQLRTSQRLDLRDAVTVVSAADTILEPTQQAYDDAEAWLAMHASSGQR